MSLFDKEHCNKYIDEEIEITGEEAQYMFHGTSHESYLNILKTGFITDVKCNTHIRSVWLTTDIKIAQKFAMRNTFYDKIPVILMIDSEQMKRDGLSFYDWTESSYQTDDIPVKYIVKEIFCNDAESVENN